VTVEDYRRALDAAVREYEALIKQRADLDGRIAQLTHSIGTLTRLCGYVPTVPWGLTEACRMVLKAAGQPLTVTEVRAQLEAMGFDLSRYSNALAAIHTVIRRLGDSHETELVARAWSKPAYVWKGVPPDIPRAIADVPAAQTRARKARRKK
jgi:hypothetical protein